jgi:hypothetical protein
MRKSWFSYAAILLVTIPVLLLIKEVLFILFLDQQVGLPVLGIPPRPVPARY